MSYTAGTNIFPIYVTDISGNAITGISSGFSVQGQVGSTIIDTVSVVETSGAGWYFATVSLPVGQGYVEFKHSNPSYFITGTYDINTTVFDTDDIYSNFARQNLELTQTALGVYESQDIGPFKEGDDWDFTYVIPDSVAVDISGYSNFKASIITQDGLTTPAMSGSAYIGDFTLTVDTSTKSIRMVALSSVTNGTVPNGSLETVLYSDLQCLDINGRKKTLAEFTITVRRQFTYG